MTEKMDGAGGFKLEKSIEIELIKAGWFVGRDLASEWEAWKAWWVCVAGLPNMTSAEKVLREFGQLSIGRVGPGYNCASYVMRTDPMLVQYDVDLVQQVASVVGLSVFPLGTAHGGHVYVLIAEDGRVFQAMEKLWLVADSFEIAIRCAYEGIAPMDMGWLD